MSAQFRFFRFPFEATSSQWYQGWVAAALACFELQSETGGLIDFFERAVNRLTDLNSSKDNAVKSLGTRFLDGFRNFLVHLGLN